MSEVRRVVRDGLWDNNVVFAQMLGMCPTLATTGSATNGLGMGLDFREIKNLLREALSTLDHACLNDLPPFAACNPTAENIARHARELLEDQAAYRRQKEDLAAAVSLLGPPGAHRRTADMVFRLLGMA